MSVRHQAVRCPYLSPIFQIDLLPYLVKAGLRTDVYRCRCRLVIYTNHISPIFPPGSSLLISFSASPFVRGWILQICNVRSCYPARPGSAHSDTLSQETTSQFQPKKKEEVATKKKRWRKSPNWNLNLIAKLQSKAVLSHTTRVRTQWARNLF